MPEGGQSQSNSLPIIVGIILIALLPLAFILGSSIVNSNTNKPNPEGAELGTPIDPASPEIREVLNSFTVLSNPEDVLSHPEKLDGIKASLIKLRDGLNSKDPAYSQITNNKETLDLIEKMLGEIDSIKATAKNNRAAAKATLDQLLKDRETLGTTALAIVGGDTSPPKGGFALPIHASSITGFGNSAHYCSKDSNICRPRHRPFLKGSGAFGSSLSLKDNKGSATDISARAGANVFAPFTGKVVRSRACLHKNCSDGGYIIMATDDKRYVSALLHIRSVVNTGDVVQAGAKIGTISNIGYDHLHFELWINGSVVWSENKSGNPNRVIWNNQKAAMGF